MPFERSRRRTIVDSASRSCIGETHTHTTCNCMLSDTSRIHVSIDTQLVLRNCISLYCSICCLGISPHPNARHSKLVFLLVSFCGNVVQMYLDFVRPVSRGSFCNVLLYTYIHIHSLLHCNFALVSVRRMHEVLGGDPVQIGENIVFPL